MKRLLFGLALVALGSACAFSYRAERTFSKRISVGDWDSLWVELGHAPKRVVQAPPGEEALWIEATVSALGGNERVAREHAEGADVMTEDLGDTLRVFPYWPAESEGVIDFQTESLVLPRGMPLSLVAGVGDVEFNGLSGDLDLDLVEGGVVIEDAQADVGVKTGRGHIDIQLNAGSGEGNEFGYAVDAHTRLGHVRLEHQGDGPIYVESHSGDLEISIASDANLDVFVLASDGIDVDTEQLSVDEPYGQWTERLGDGSRALVAIAYDGSVQISDDL
jgi:hypothetical protein